jgi:membrane-associated phospholipid phosphatase
VLLPLVRTMSRVALVLVFCVASVRAESGLERAGDITEVAIPAIAGLSTLVAGDSEGTSQFCKSFLGTVGITYALKYTIHKDRPEGHGKHSFPSGHTAVAFQGATFIGKRYGWRFGVPCYLAAAFVGWSRIEAESDKHDAVDVFGGGAIGVLVTYCFTTSHKMVALVPTVDHGTYGVCMSTRW